MRFQSAPTFALPVLRIGLGVTFFWIGVYILRQPDAWAGYIQPWAVSLLPMSPENMMLATGGLDVLLGVLLVINLWTWLVAVVASLHLVVVLVVSGINVVTVRDIGLLAAAVTLVLAKWPLKWPPKWPPKWPQK